MQEEIWKDIPNYEGLYQVSNLGNVKSLSRICYDKNGIRIRRLNTKIIKNFIDVKGYSNNYLYKFSSLKKFKTHQLVAIAFLNHKICGMKLIVDHINDNKIDNRVENLQVVTSRFNTYKTQDKYSSKYKGVSWSKQCKLWRARITINNKEVFLGFFKIEEDARDSYNNKLIEYYGSL